MTPRDPQMNSDNAPESASGCREYQGLSRRQFLARSGMAGTAAVTLPHWLPNAIGRSMAPVGDVFISVFLRGGWDGLSFLSPYNDSWFTQTARPNLHLDSTDVINIDGYFGMNNLASGLHNIYQLNSLAVVNDVSVRYPFVGTPSRSHFEMMDVLEFSAFSNGVLDGSNGGWIGRHLNETPPVAPLHPLRAAALSVANPKSHAGNTGTLPVSSPANFGLAGDASSKAARQLTLETMFTNVDPILQGAADTTFAAIDLLGQIDFPGYIPNVTYPGSTFGTQLKNTAALLKNAQEIESVHIDYGGWDDHNNLGPLDPDGFGGRLQDLSDSLWAFFQDMGLDMRRITILVYSEFGRRVFENASLGTDHGHGNCSLVIGGRVNGGLYIPPNWVNNGLQQHITGLNDEDLPGTYDFRDVFLEILRDRLGNTAPDSVMFPEFTPGTPLDIVN